MSTTSRRPVVLRLPRPLKKSEGWREFGTLLRLPYLTFGDVPVIHSGVSDTQSLPERAVTVLQFPIPVTAPTLSQEGLSTDGPWSLTLDKNVYINVILLHWDLMEVADHRNILFTPPLNLCLCVFSFGALLTPVLITLRRYSVPHGSCRPSVVFDPSVFLPIKGSQKFPPYRDWCGTKTWTSEVLTFPYVRQQNSRS